MAGSMLCVVFCYGIEKNNMLPSIQIWICLLGATKFGDAGLDCSLNLLFCTPTPHPSRAGAAVKEN